MAEQNYSEIDPDQGATHVISETDTNDEDTDTDTETTEEPAPGTGMPSVE